MSMLNIVVQQDSAYLLTDSGHFTDSGVIHALHPKTMVIDELDLALATTGSLHLGHVALALLDVTVTDQGNFIRALPRIARVACDLAKIDPVQRPSFVAVAFYERKRRRAGGLILWTAQDAGPHGLAPWCLHPAIDVLMPAIDRSVACVADLSRSASFDPSRDFGPIIEAQRRSRAWLGSSSASHIGVAGAIELTTVGEAGVTVETVHTFPDRIGLRAAA